MKMDNSQWAPQNDVCDCDKRCKKCGKLKEAPLIPVNPRPYLPYPNGWTCYNCGKFVYSMEYHVCPQPVFTYTTGPITTTEYWTKAESEVDGAK
jgi:hypothetical protein